MSGSRKRRRRTPDPGIPLVPASAAALLAAIVLGAAVGSFPVAGVSALLLEKHLWLDAMPVAGNPLWGMIARALVHFAPVAPIAVMNGFSLVCGVGAATLFFYLNARLLQLMHSGRETYVYVMCGLSAAMYLVVSTPFWIAGSRAHPLSFDVLLLLVAIFLQSEYHRTHRISYLYAFAFVFGVGLVEYAMFLVLAWPLGILTLYLMRRRGHLRRRKRTQNLLTSAGWLIAGMLVVVVPACWQMTRSPAQFWMENPEWSQMLRRLLVAEWTQVLGSVNQTGWLLIGMVSVVPWIVCLIEIRHTSSLRLLSSLVLYVLLSAFPLMILFHAPISPFEILGDRTLVVAPYLFIASTFGLLVNYWHAAMCRLWRPQAGFLRWLRIPLVSLLPAAVVVAPLFGFSKVTPEPSRVLYRCAEEIIDALGNREWLVTDGSLDSLIHLAALDANQDLFLLNVRQGSNEAYRRLLASRFDEPRLRSLALLGPLPLLREMLQTDPEITAKLAFLNTGDMWLEAGYEPVPERLIFLGRSSGAIPEPAPSVLARHAPFWEHTVPRLRRTETLGGSHGQVARHLRWQVSRVANDVGIMLQRTGQDEAARLAYTAASIANDLNASAIINLGGAREGDFAEEMWDELDLPLPALVSRHGHIYRIADLPPRGEARDSAGTSMPHLLQERFADAAAHFKSGDLSRCAETLELILLDDPSNTIAWYLRGLLAAKNREQAAWDKCWEFMQTQPRPWPAFLMIRGEHLVREGRISDGLKRYEQAFELSPYDPRIVRPVALAELSFGSPRHAESYVTQLLSLDPSDPWGNFALGSIQFGRGEWELAESSLRVAVDRLRLPDAHNNLAWILTLNGKIDEAEQQVAAALSLDPEFAPAWDTMGVIHMKNGDRVRAEIALQRALQLEPKNWDARVHKAQLDLAAGRAQDALASARALEVEATGKSHANLTDYRTLRRDLDLPPRVPSD